MATDEQLPDTMKRIDLSIAMQIGQWSDVLDRKRDTIGLEPQASQLWAVKNIMRALELGPELQESITHILADEMGQLATEAAQKGAA